MSEDNVTVTGNLVEVTIFYTAWDGTRQHHKQTWNKFDVGAFADEVCEKGFRRVDEGGFYHQHPAQAVLEVIWSDTPVCEDVP